MRIHGILLTLFWTLISSNVYAQYSTENLNLNEPVLAWYDQQIGKNNAGLLVGEYQEMKRLSYSTHQFYGSDEWSIATIHFRNQRYDSILSLYDIEKDILVIKHPTDFKFHNQPIRLAQNQIAWFTLHHKIFRYYPKGILAQNPGFFNELYVNDHLKLLVKRMKIIETNQELVFETRDRYFLQVNDEYYRVTGRFSILKALKPYKTKIKAFVKNHDLKLKAKVENEAGLIQLMNYTHKLISENE